MAFVVSPLIEDALRAAAAARLPPAVLGGATLTAAVIARSRRYTSERERLSAPVDALGADLAARALFFSIADAAKLHLPLRELSRGLLPAPPGFLTGESLSVLDAGAGCGAMTLGLLTFLAETGRTPRLAVTLVDRDGAALAIAADAIARVARALKLEVAVTPRTGDLAAVPLGRYDLVVAGTVINEIADAGVRLALVSSWLAALAAGGVAIIIEPALRDTTRALHGVRDALVASGRATVLAPCTRRGAPCPALADPDDWCHDHRPLELPSRAQQLAGVTGLRDGDMKLSYLALAAAGTAPATDRFRVVADPRAEKGKHELVLCGEEGWVSVRLLRRHRSVANRGVERARRGDLLAISPSASGDLGPEHQVEIRRAD